LETIPWGRSFQKIPRIAGAHHELLDGRGYPLGLKGEEIAIETRMLTIADIFDALTASDRPYKPAVPVPKALAIIEGEVKAGRCAVELLKWSVGAGVSRKVIWAGRSRSWCGGGPGGSSIARAPGGWRRGCARRWRRSAAAPPRPPWCSPTTRRSAGSTATTAS